MATSKVLLNFQRPNQMEELPIVIRVTHHRVSRMVPINRHLNLVAWDAETKSIKIPNGLTRSEKLFYQKLLTYVNDQKLIIDNIILDFDKKNTPYTSDDVKIQYQKQTGKLVAANTYFTYFEKHMKDLEAQHRYPTKNNKHAALMKFKEFRKGRDVEFEALNPTLISDFINYCYKADLNVNTIITYISALRSTYNKAVEEEYIEINTAPFRKVKLKPQETIKRSLSKDYIKIIRDYNSNGNPRTEFARNIFMFCYYTRGTSIKDALCMKVYQILENRFYYYRFKTKRLYNIKLIPEAMEIVSKYSDLRDPDSYIFPGVKGIHEELEKSYHLTYEKVYRGLKKIAKELNIPINLTSYVSRHSWANIAKNSQVSISVISEGMGHSSERMTRIYLRNFEDPVLDEANEKVTNL